jgi:zinc and cadmium transporter
MDTFLWILAGTFFVSLAGAVGVLAFPLKEKQLKSAIYVLTAFAIGGLLGGSFFHLLPEAFGKMPAETALLYTLAGFLAFLIVESYFHWHLCSDCDIHPYSYLLLFGDGIHNFIDGLVIASSFLVSVPFGLVTSVIVFAHEIPEELGIFGVLIKGGLDKRKAVTYSFLAQSTAMIGGAAGYFLSASILGFSSFLIPFAAGGFIYIAASGLIPEMHKEEGVKRVVSLMIIFIGLLFMWALKAYGPAV